MVFCGTRGTLEVHHGSAQDIPIVGTALDDHSRLHGAHIDHIETLGVFDEDVGESLKVVIGEGLQTTIVRILREILNSQVGVFLEIVSINKSNILRSTN